jgi:hypothetical protein
VAFAAFGERSQRAVSAALLKSALEVHKRKRKMLVKTGTVDLPPNLLSAEEEVKEC